MPQHDRAREIAERKGWTPRTQETSRPTRGAKPEDIAATRGWTPRTNGATVEPEGPSLLSRALDAGRGLLSKLPSIDRTAVEGVRDRPIAQQTTPEAQPLRELNARVAERAREGVEGVPDQGPSHLAANLAPERPGSRVEQGATGLTGSVASGLAFLAGSTARMAGQDEVADTYLQKERARREFFDQRVSEIQRERTRPIQIRGPQGYPGVLTDEEGYAREAETNPDTFGDKLVTTGVQSAPLMMSYLLGPAGGLLLLTQASGEIGREFDEQGVERTAGTAAGGIGLAGLYAAIERLGGPGSRAAGSMLTRAVKMGLGEELEEALQSLVRVYGSDLLGGEGRSIPEVAQELREQFGYAFILGSVGGAPANIAQGGRVFPELPELDISQFPTGIRESLDRARQRFVDMVDAPGLDGSATATLKGLIDLKQNHPAAHAQILEIGRQIGAGEITPDAGSSRIARVWNYALQGRELPEFRDHRPDAHTDPASQWPRYVGQEAPPQEPVPDAETRERTLAAAEAQMGLEGEQTEAPADTDLGWFKDRMAGSDAWELVEEFTREEDGDTEVVRFYRHKGDGRLATTSGWSNLPDYDANTYFLNSDLEWKTEEQMSAQRNYAYLSDDQIQEQIAFDTERFRAPAPVEEAPAAPVPPPPAPTPAVDPGVAMERVGSLFEQYQAADEAYDTYLREHGRAMDPDAIAAMRARDQLKAPLMEALRDAYPNGGLQFSANEGNTRITITRSAKGRNWQKTHFDQRGPFMDTQHDNLLEAMADLFKYENQVRPADDLDQWVGNFGAPRQGVNPPGGGVYAEDAPPTVPEEQRPAPVTEETAPKAPEGETTSQPEVQVGGWRERKIGRAARGKKAQAVFPGTGRKVEVEYRIVEADDLVASHTGQYTKRSPEEFPEEIQGRAYHGPQGRQAREFTEGIIQKFDPDRAVDAALSVADGPATVTEGGLAVAGNGRIIVAQRLAAQNPEAAQAYRLRLAQAAPVLYGIDATSIDSFQNPVLVRVITDPSVDPTNVDQLRELNAASDMASGKTKDVVSDAATRAAQFARAERSLRHMQESMPEDASIRSYLDSRDGRTFLKLLVSEGVIPEAERARFIDVENGTATDEGKLVLERIFLTAAIGSPDLVATAPKGVLRKLDTSLPAIVKANQIEGWEIQPVLQEAIGALTAADAAGIKLDDFLSQIDFSREPVSEEAATMARFLDTAPKNTRGDTKGVKDAFRAYAAEAEAAARQGQSDDLFGFEPRSAEEAQRDIAAIFPGKFVPPPESRVDEAAEVRQVAVSDEAAASRLRIFRPTSRFPSGTSTPSDSRVTTTPPESEGRTTRVSPSDRQTPTSEATRGSVIGSPVQEGGGASPRQLNIQGPLIPGNIGLDQLGAMGSRRLEISQKYRELYGEIDQIVAEWSQPYSDPTELVARAQELKDDYEQWIREQGAEVPGFVKPVPNVKSAESLLRKMQTKKRDASNIGDVLRSYVVMEDIEGVHAMAQKLLSTGNVLELDDLLANPNAFGYGAIHIQLQYEGLVTEVQITTPRLLEVKEIEGGHATYERWRDVMGSEVSEEQFAEFWDDITAQLDAYNDGHMDALDGAPPRGTVNALHWDPDRGRYIIVQNGGRIVNGSPNAATWKEGPILGEFASFREAWLAHQQMQGGGGDTEAIVGVTDTKRALERRIAEIEARVRRTGRVSVQERERYEEAQSQLRALAGEGMRGRDAAVSRRRAEQEGLLQEGLALDNQNLDLFATEAPSPASEEFGDRLEDLIAEYDREAATQMGLFEEPSKADGLTEEQQQVMHTFEGVLADLVGYMKQNPEHTELDEVPDGSGSNYLSQLENAWDTFDEYGIEREQTSELFDSLEDKLYEWWEERGQKKREEARTPRVKLGPFQSPPSKRIQKWAEDHPEIVQEYWTEYDDFTGPGKPSHWLVLREPYYDSESDTQTIHEGTVNQVMQRLRDYVRRDDEATIVTDWGGEKSIEMNGRVYELGQIPGIGWEVRLQGKKYGVWERYGEGAVDTLKDAKELVEEVERKRVQKNTVEALTATQAAGVNTLANLGPMNMTEQGTDAKKVPKPSQIVKDLSAALDKVLQGFKVAEGKLPRAAKGAMAVFNARTQVIRSMSLNELRLFGHEAGHAMQQVVFLNSRAERLTEEQLAVLPGAIRGELEDLGQDQFEGSGGKSGLLKEGWAEFWRYYLDNPEWLETGAPNLLEFVEGHLKQNAPEVLEAWKKAQKDWTLWREATPQARLRSRVSRDESPQNLSIRDHWRRFRTNMVDDFEPIRYLVDSIRKRGVEVTPEEDAEMLARLTRGSVGQAEHFLDFGTLDFKTLDTTGKSLKEILQPLGDNLDVFRDYIVAKRVQELDDRNIATGIERADADWTVEQVEQGPNGKAMKAAWKDLLDYQEAVLTYLRDSGVISRQSFKLIQRLNQSYVPFQRVMEGQGIGGLGMGFSHLFSPVKRIKGSGRDIIDPLESIVKNTYVYTHLAAKQQVSNALANLAEKPGLGDLLEGIVTPMKPTKMQLGEVDTDIDDALPGFSAMLDELAEKARKEWEAETKDMDPSELREAIRKGLVDPKPWDPREDILTIFRPGSMVGRENTISVLRDGKRKYFEVDPELYRALAGLDREKLDLMGRWLSKPASLLRAGATLAPEFQIRNPIRDQLMAAIQSEYGYIPFVDMVPGLLELLRKGEVYQDWIASGGERAALLSLDRNSMQRKLGELLDSGGVPNVIKNPLDLMRAISALMEDATRMGEFIKARKAHGGADATKVGLQLSSGAGREVSIDFARHGAKLTALRAMAAFWNARIQGYDRLARAFKNNPGKASMMAFSFITLPSLIEYALNRDDEDYWRQPQWQRDLFWMFKIRGEWARIPKPFELGLIFGTLPTRILQTIDGYGLHGELGEFFSSTLLKEAESFVPIPTAAQPLLENVVNWSFFLDRPIVPRSEENVLPRYQSGPYTSVVATELAQWVPGREGISPRKIDNLLYSYTGGLGRLGTELVEGAMDPAGFVERKIAEGPAGFPGIRGVAARQPGFGSSSIEAFYRMRGESQAAVRTVNFLESEERWEELEKELEDPQGNQLRALSRTLTKTADRIAEYRALADIIDRDDTLSEKEKKDQIEELGRAATEEAEAALELYKGVRDAERD